MRRLAVLGLCLCIFPYCALTAFAEDTTTSTAPQNDAVISVSVPSAHTLTVTAPDGVTVTLDGVAGNNFNVERLSEPTLAVNIPDGQEIVKIVLNGEDVTDKFANGQYKLPPVYENLALEVETKAAAEPTTSTTEPTTSTTEPTTSSTTDSTTSSTTTSESSSTTSSETTSSSKPDSSTSSTTTSSNSGGTNNSNDNKTYPNNDSPNTGDVMAVSIGVPAFFLGVAFLMVLLKKRNKDEE